VLALFPEVCPACQSAVHWEGEHLVCTNVENCPAQTVGRIRRWVKGLGILEWGEVVIEKLVVGKHVESVADLYRLRYEDLVGISGLGEVSARKLLSELRRPLPVSLPKFLGSLCVPLCGEITFEALVLAGFYTVEKLRTARSNQLCTVPSVGPSRAEALVAWLTKNHAMVDDILEAGVSLRERSSGKLTGKSVCFTGKSSRPRAELERLAEQAGASVKSSVVRGLTYLVMSDPESTSSKAQAARKLGTACISEIAFVDLC
jgi:DNA ligase (NAD+)